MLWKEISHFIQEYIFFISQVYPATSMDFSTCLSTIDPIDFYLSSMVTWYNDGINIKSVRRLLC